ESRTPNKKSGSTTSRDYEHPCQIWSADGASQKRPCPDLLTNTLKSCAMTKAPSAVLRTMNSDCPGQVFDRSMNDQDGRLVWLSRLTDNLYCLLQRASLLSNKRCCPSAQDYQFLR